MSLTLVSCTRSQAYFLAPIETANPTFDQERTAPPPAPSAPLGGIITTFTGKFK